MRKLYLLLTLVCTMIAIGETRAQLLAFPEADGYGKYTTGGRGGEVCYVTRTDDCSDNDLVPGTLRWALRHNNGGKPRTVLFNVHGTIYLTSVLKLQYGDISILGQSAPGGGVCIAGHNLYICRDNVIVRYVRFRAGDIPNTSMTGLDMENCQNVILDHCSITWSMEESLTAYDSKNTTVQWCIIGEALYNSKNVKGDRAFATQWGGERSTMHHTLITNSRSRSPRFNGVRDPADGHDKYVDSEFANNVVFNWGRYNAMYGGENFSACNGYDRVYMINNFYRPGPSTQLATSSRRYFASPSVDEGTGQYGEWYLKGNKFEVDGKFSSKEGVWSKANLELVNNDNYYGIQAGSSNRALDIPSSGLQYLLTEIPYALSGLEYESADDAFSSVTTKAGASLPRYDEVDRRLLDEAAGTIDPRFHGETIPTSIGIIDSPDDIELEEHDTYIVDGVEYTNYPFLGMREGDKYMVDSDGDGLPDAYEDEIGLNPLDATDAAGTASNGYTHLENYLNGIACGTIQKSDYETSAEYVEPGLALRPENVTYTFSKTDDVEGTPPTGATIAYGAEITIPQNTSLYKEGNTLTEWTANQRRYEIGKTYSVESDMTLTPVFAQNRLNLDDRSKETTVTWDFTLDGAPAISATAGKGIYVNQVQVDDYVIDARISYDGTSITIPWCEGASVKANGAEAEATANGDEATATVDVASYLPLQNIAVTLPYVKNTTHDTYHSPVVMDNQNYELVMMPENQDELDAVDWIEVIGGEEPRFINRYGLDPYIDDGETGQVFWGPVINGTTRVLALYVTQTGKIRAWVFGSNSNGDKVTMTATPEDGSGSTSVRTVNFLTKSGQSEVIELADLDPTKSYTVTLASVNDLDMMIPAVKLYSDGSTGISDVKSDDARSDAPKYNISGQRVNDSYKGIVIQNGKKYIAK